MGNKKGSNDLNQCSFFIEDTSSCNIRDTAFSHDRTFLIEVMGKNSPYLAIRVGVGTGKDSSEGYNYGLNMPVLEPLNVKTCTYCLM